MNEITPHNIILCALKSNSLETTTCVHAADVFNIFVDDCPSTKTNEISRLNTYRNEVYESPGARTWSLREAEFDNELDRMLYG